MFLFDRKPNVFKRHRALFIWGIIILFVILIVIIVLLAILPFILVAGYAGFTMAETPEFCGYVCHNMKPYYESYENSTHKGIKCAECHNEPGFIGFFKGTVIGAMNESYLYISGNYDKEPIVCDMSGRSCTREECHKTERLYKKESIFQGITFRHDVHSEIIGNIKLKCSSCHSTDSLVHMKINVKTCLLCHTSDIISREEPLRCLDCHSTTISDIKAYNHTSVLQNKTSCSNCHKSAHLKQLVEQERCDLCHREKPVKKETYTEEELHKIHTFEHTVDCIMCHNEVTHTFKPAFSANCLDCHKEIKTLRTTKFKNRSFPHLLHTSRNIASCETCHSKKKETHGKLLISEASCRKCHHTQKKIECAKCHTIANAIQNGLAIGGTKGVEGYKTGVIDCKACHKKLTEPSSLARIKEKCAKCHEDDYKELVTEWQTSTIESIKEIENKIRVTNTKGNSEAEKLMKDVKRLLFYVKVDGSKGVHNPDYIEEMLNNAKKKTDKAEKLVKGN